MSPLGCVLQVQVPKLSEDSDVQKIKILLLQLSAVTDLLSSADKIPCW